MDFNQINLVELCSTKITICQAQSLSLRRQNRHFKNCRIVQINDIQKEDSMEEMAFCLALKLTLGLSTEKETPCKENTLSKGLRVGEYGT